MTHGKTNDPLWLVLGMVIVVIIALLLGGCATTKRTVESLTPVCKALGPPHVYNTHNFHSPYHAGPKLAPRLHRDNDVGTNLRCKGY